MAIVTSDPLIRRHFQPDGSFWVLERHVDSEGVEHIFEYIAKASDNLTAIRTARAASLSQLLTIREIKQNISEVSKNGSLATVTVHHSTAAQNYSALRRFYQDATRLEAVMIGDFLSSRSNAELQTAFSMTAGEVDTLRTQKLTPAAALASGIRNSAGE